tara:strand:- start:11504 stop:12091 length:588 start_codon:yes stop_codon:yes gene_type:complete
MSQEILPYRQGALDHWCGLYSVVNAIHLLVGPYEDSSCVDIFAEAQCALLKLRKGRLTSRVEKGVTPKEMKSLLESVSEEFGLGVRTLRLDAGGRQVATLFGYWRALQRYLERANGRASSRGAYTGMERGIAVVFVSGTYRHWTIVRAATNREVLLFDSCGFERIFRRKITVGRHTRLRPRLVSGSSTFLVYLRE